MAYKNKDITTEEKEQWNVNYESVGVRRDCYRYYFKCKYCDNQSIADDEGTIWSCNNLIHLVEDNGVNVYCGKYLIKKH